jgi:ankyrin repeat protein
MEYQEALSLSPGQTSLDNQKYPNDMNKVMRNCCGLVSVDEEDSTVHYVHHSVKQHLFSIKHSLSDEFDIKKLDQHLGLLCMTYLDFTTFRRQVAKVTEGSNTPITPIQLGITPIYRSRNDTSRMAMKLLSHRQHLQHLSARELERKSRQLFKDLEPSRLDKDLQNRDFQFLDYARSCWIHHVTDLDPVDTQMWKFFSRCVDGDIILAHRPWESTDQTDDERNDVPRAIQWLLTHGHFTLFLYYAQNQSDILTEKAKLEILKNSRIQDRGRFTKLIIQQIDNSPEIRKYALFNAAREGDTASVDDLLRAGMDVNARVDNRTALQGAAEGGHLEVVERLLAANADVNTPVEGKEQTALQAAAGGGHLAVVERLLVANAKVNIPDNGEGHTALQAAAGGGHLAVVERLLEAKAKVNSITSMEGRTAIQAAAGGGHLDVVERLLMADAKVNTPINREGRTALQAAAGGGHLEVVERLLEAEANVNAAASGLTGRTALQAAAEEGHVDVVEKLLEAKADVNAAASADGYTALEAAAAGGHLEVVERLLEAKAELNPPTSGGRYALQLAAVGGHTEVAERLRQAGAEISRT